jgi:molybdate transport system substrate-binding protein
MVAATPSPVRGLVLADPAAVPAGIYARQRLELAGRWLDVARRVVPAVDARAALALVVADPEMVGIVYRTDAVSSPDIATLFILPHHPDVAIEYWGALVERDGPAQRSELARAFLDHVLGQPAVATRHGFLVPATAVPPPSSTPPGPASAAATDP